jgi:hypothetical protein
MGCESHPVTTSKQSVQRHRAETLKTLRSRLRPADLVDMVLTSFRCGILTRSRAQVVAAWSMPKRLNEAETRRGRVQEPQSGALPGNHGRSMTRSSFALVGKRSIRLVTLRWWQRCAARWSGSQRKGASADRSLTRTPCFTVGPASTYLRHALRISRHDWPSPQRGSPSRRRRCRPRVSPLRAG